MKWVLKFVGVEELLEAVVKRFNIPFMLRALRAFVAAIADKRADNEALHTVALAAAARAEVLSPSGGGYEKYKAVFAAILAESKSWVIALVADVVDAFESRIDDEIQLVHREVELILREHGSAKLGEISASLDDYPMAVETMKALASLRGA